MYHAIVEINAGRKYICDEIRTMIVTQAVNEERKPTGWLSISIRETEIISLIKKGNSSKEIASALNISIKTVEVHRYNILKKLGLKNAAALIHFIHVNNLY